MSNIPPKPIRDANTVEDHGFLEDERDYYRAIAERAIEALNNIEVKVSGGLCSFTAIAKHEFLKDIRIEVEKALSELTDTGERG